MFMRAVVLFVISVHHAAACACQNFIDVLGWSCETIENQYDVDCNDCDCSTTTTSPVNHFNTTSFWNEVNISYDTFLYISLASNIVFGLLLILSESMGTSTKCKFNGIVDAIVKAYKTQKKEQKKRKEVELT